MASCCRTLDIGVRYDVGHLGGKRDHTVVFFRRRDRKLAEPAGFQHLLDPLQKLNIVIDRRHQHHRRVFKHVRPGILITGVMCSCHRMTAHIGKSVLFSQAESQPAYALLIAQTIDHYGVRINVRRFFFKPGLRRMDIRRDQQKVAFLHVVTRQHGVHSSVQHGKTLDRLVDIISVHPVSGFLISFYK